MPADIAKGLIEAGVAIQVEETSRQSTEVIEEAVPEELVETTTRRPTRRNQAAIKPEE